MDAKNTDQKGRKGKDRWVKLGFILVTTVVVIVIYWAQRRPLRIADWGDDLAEALAAAKADNHPVLVLFESRPPSPTGQALATTTLINPGNVKAIQDGCFLRVIVTVGTSLTSETARLYKLRVLPTMLTLDADGGETNRREGFVGELDFRHGFLDGAQVVGPQP